MQTLAAVIAYLNMLMDGWETMSDAERNSAVQLALEAARRASGSSAP